MLPPSLRELVDETVASERKIIVVTGGVLSGIGKGVTASSIGVLLRAMGLRVTALKIDPYLNVDAGTMSPFEHGEVFVLDDGGETDLDLGNYERFLSVSLTKESNLSTGKIYQSVIDRERMGDYLGKTVQVVPHISGKIQKCYPTSTMTSTRISYDSYSFACHRCYSGMDFKSSEGTRSKIWSIRERNTGNLYS